MKFKSILFVLVLATTVNLSAKDGVPFIHSFGELRVYFQDWLVVCADKGAGECRMVNYVNKDNSKTGFFPNSRLSITPTQAQTNSKLDFYNQGAPSELNAMSIKIDKKVFVFDASDYKTPNENRIMETYIVSNHIKIDKLTQASKPARWLTFRYTGISGQESEVQFSLRGFTKAFNFIQNKKLGC